MFCLCENKGTDQLCSYCTADQRLCFRFTDSTITPLLISKNLRILLSSLTVQAGLCGSWSETPNTDFLASRLIGKVLRPFHCVHLKCSNFWAGSIYFTSKLTIADVEKKVDTRNQCKFTVQNRIRSNTRQFNNKPHHQQAAPPTRLVYTFPALCLYTLHILFKIMLGL